MTRQWTRAASDCASPSTALKVNWRHLSHRNGGETFHSVHVEAAGRVAAHALEASVERLVHLSGIGADPTSQSLYIRKRGEGEFAVRAAFANSVLIRPAVMFASDDGFLTIVLNLLRRLPVYPIFGGGTTRLQPVYVEDVAEAIAAILLHPDAQAQAYEFGGPRVYTYAEFLKSVAHEADLKPILVPVPFTAWHALARIFEMLPKPAITTNQIELMQIDTVTSPMRPGLTELGVSPHAVEEILQQMVSRR
jgi:uncharacterized protein YbjT (DUF2867 family)